MSQLNSKAFFWLSAASLQSSVLLGGAVLAPSSLAQSSGSMPTAPVTKNEVLTKGEEGGTEKVEKNEVVVQSK